MNFSTKLHKLTIRSLEIYEPYSVSYTLTSKSIDCQKRFNEDFDIVNYLHFPVIINNDGSLWKYGNLYLLSKLKSYKKPSPKTLESTAFELKKFKEYCDSNDVNYLNAPRKILRPTYLYREYLESKLKNGDISRNTVKKSMSVIIGFYEYLIETEGVKFKYPLWEKGFTSISYHDAYGFKQSKKVETKDISTVVSTSNPDLFDDAIVDGGRLHPLTQKEQIEVVKALKQLGNPEMTLGFLISLTTGARIQTVYTLRLKHFDKELSDEEKEVKIKVGLGTDCDTKNDKIHILIMPTWVYEKVKVYIRSERYKKRIEKAKHIFEDIDLQYAFLNNRGIPFYAAKNDPYRDLYSKPPNGDAVRIFIYKTLSKQLEVNGVNIKFSFHDLRASFGMNKFDALIELTDTKKISIKNILIHIRDLMGHTSLYTTEKYLKFRERHLIRENAQDSFEKHLKDMINE